MVLLGITVIPDYLAVNGTTYVVMLFHIQLGRHKSLEDTWFTRVLMAAASAMVWMMSFLMALSLATHRAKFMQ